MGGDLQPTSPSLLHVSPSSIQLVHLYPSQPVTFLPELAQVSMLSLGMLGGSRSPQLSCADASCHSLVVPMPFGAVRLRLCNATEAQLESYEAMTY